ncbi:hypothetical protein EMCG_00232 [[Emmonsia] crescens]|uniref:RRM domain-containing protein n=1 Tax=[Emmonsia] crescens TaxID=73230 RepID=A0A0G2I2H8_9EURO|nr:hypothetical protein EMCG_00232 [Emmonsia crescens UAMH 3008]
MTNRGTAYILYYEVADAEAAISHMHEAQLDGAVLNVSIVLPRRTFSRSPPPARNRGDFGRFDRPAYGRGFGRAPGLDTGRPPPPPGRYRSPPPRHPVPHVVGRPPIPRDLVLERHRHAEGLIPGTALFAVGDGTLVIAAIVTVVGVEAEARAEAEALAEVVAVTVEEGGSYCLARASPDLFVSPKPFCNFM